MKRLIETRRDLATTCANLVFIDEHHKGVWIDTLDIARATGKQHSHILRICHRLAKSRNPHLDHENDRPIFKKMSYKVRGREYLRCLLNRPAALALMLSFTGPKWDAFRLEVATLFVMRERELVAWRKTRSILRNSTRAFHSSVERLRRKLIEEVGENRGRVRMLYVNVHKAIGRAVTGTYGAIDRETADKATLALLDALEAEIGRMIEEGLDAGKSAEKVREEILNLLRNCSETDEGAA